MPRTPKYDEYQSLYTVWNKVKFDIYYNIIYYYNYYSFINIIIDSVIIIIIY